MSIVLASGSPRRRELIQLLFRDVKVLPAAISEEAGKLQTPAEYALSCQHKGQLRLNAAPNRCWAPMMVVAWGEDLENPLLLRGILPCCGN